MKENKWHNGETVTDLPEYVRIMENKSDYIRGESQCHIAGTVFMVKNHFAQLTLHGSLRWQRYSYSLFIPATKDEYDPYDKLYKDLQASEIF